MAELAKTWAERMEICGGFAAGKTTLAKLIEKEGHPVVYDVFTGVPSVIKPKRRGSNH